MTYFSPEFLEQLRQKQKKKDVPANTDKEVGDTASSKDTIVADSDREKQIVVENGSPPKDGIQEIKDNQGRLAQRIPYKDGKIDGMREIYDVDSGQVIQTTMYEQGVLNGMMKGYDVKGSILQEIDFKKEKKEGVATFYTDSAKRAEITYANDLMNGLAIYYAPQGYISAKANYKEGSLEGAYTIFDEKGGILKESLYKEGKLEGPSKIFYPDGKILEDAVYENNVPKDKVMQYYPNGNTKVIRTYKDGKLDKEELFDESGRPQGSTEGMYSKGGVQS